MLLSASRVCKLPSGSHCQNRVGLPSSLIARRKSTGVVQASAPLSSDQVKKAIDFQLKRSSGSSDTIFEPPTPPPEQTEEDLYNQELQERVAEARKWIEPWLAKKASERSETALGELRTRMPLMSSGQEDAALERLTGTPKPSTPASSDPSSDPSSDLETPAGESGGKYDPVETYEDGSVLYSAALLGGVSYEDVLAP